MQIDNLEIVMLPVNSIIPYWRNPRRNDKTVDALVDVIKKNGFNVPIVVDKNHVVVKGHARLRAAKRLGMEQVPCIISNAPEDVIKADRIADNKIQELSTWEASKLDMELDRLGDKMTFGKLFRPEEGLEADDFDFTPQAEFQPVGLEFMGGYEHPDDGSFDVADVIPVGHEHLEDASGGGYEAPAASGDFAGPDVPAPTERKLKTLCPYCGKVVIISV